MKSCYLFLFVQSLDTLLVLEDETRRTGGKSCFVAFMYRILGTFGMLELIIDY